MRVGGEGEGWSRFPEPSWTVTEMGGSRVRNLEEGKRERRKEERKKGTVERREKMITIMLDFIGFNYRLSVSYPWFCSSLGQCVVTMALQHTSSSHITPNPSTPADGIISICPPDMPDKSCHKDPARIPSEVCCSPLVRESRTSGCDFGLRLLCMPWTVGSLSNVRSLCTPGRGSTGVLLTDLIPTMFRKNSVRRNHAKR